MSHYVTISTGTNSVSATQPEQDILGPIVDVVVPRQYQTLSLCLSREGSQGRISCGACGRRFRPDTKAQRFCDHACYSASLRVAIQDRFWSKVNKHNGSGCWLWTASTVKGYGQIASVVNGKRRPVYAHRVSWEMAYGPITDGLSVLHKCDVPLCVNPDHLFLGTQPDNLADARSKGRLVDGLSARKLSDAAYADILSRTGYGSGIALARQYGVSKITISRIRNGRQGVTYHRSAFAAVQPAEAVQQTSKALRPGAEEVNRALDGSLCAPQLG